MPLTAHEALEKLAASRNVTLQEVIKSAVREHLDRLEAGAGAASPQRPLARPAPTEPEFEILLALTGGEVLVQEPGGKFSARTHGVEANVTGQRDGWELLDHAGVYEYVRARKLPLTLRLRPTATRRECRNSMRMSP